MSTQFQRPPTFDVKIVGGKKIVIWNKSEGGKTAKPTTTDASEKISPDVKPGTVASGSDSNALETAGTTGKSSSDSDSEVKVTDVRGNEGRNKIVETEAGETDNNLTSTNINEKDNNENLPKLNSEENSPMKRRSISPNSLSSSFKVLPPIKKELEEDRPVESYDFDDESDLSSFCQLRLRDVSSRTLDVFLLELRKIDRDRDKMIHPTTISKFVTKYNLPITPCLDHLHRKFEVRQFGDLVNYEDLLKYLHAKREEGKKKVESWPHVQDYFERKPVRNGTVTVRKGRVDASRPSVGGSVTPPRKLMRSRSWTEEKESSLVEDMSRALDNSSVEVERLAEVMRSKDHYGNDQLSGQQVQDSLRQVGLKLDKSLVSRWMKSADMIGRGIYSIPVLLDILKLATMNTTGKLRSEDNTMDVNNNNNKNYHFNNNRDTTWRNILDLNSSMPKVKGNRHSLDREMKLKNVMRLKTAMYSSYNQHQGYLPPSDVVQLTLAYSTVFHLDLDSDKIRHAVEKCLGGKNSLVNIEIFTKYVLDVIM